MYRIIGGDGREYGPVTGDSIRQWVVQNRANGKTLVREENSTEWRPLGEIPEFAGSFGAPPPSPTPTAQGVETPQPTPVVPTKPPEDPAAFTATLTTRDYHLDIGGCLGTAFGLLGQQFWLVVGAAFLVIFCSTAISMVPVLGMIASLVLNQVFYGGLYFFYMKLLRGEPASIGDAFSGFSRSFGQLVLLSIVMNILISIMLIPAAIPAFGVALWHWNPVVMVPLICLLVLPVIYLSIGWMFAVMLVIDQGLEFWDAMELSRKVVGKHWFKVFLLAFTAGLIGIVGIFVLFVGALITLPIMFITMVCAYETMFHQADV